MYNSECSVCVNFHWISVSEAIAIIDNIATDELFNIVDNEDQDTLYVSYIPSYSLTISTQCILLMLLLVKNKINLFLGQSCFYIEQCKKVLSSLSDMYCSLF